MWNLFIWAINLDDNPHPSPRTFFSFGLTDFLFKTRPDIFYINWKIYTSTLLLRVKSENKLN